jgi:hypothetical protein
LKIHTAYRGVIEEGRILIYAQWGQKETNMKKIVAWIKTIWAGITADVYLSTRISPKAELQWTYEGNVKLAVAREEYMYYRFGIKALNPAKYQIKGWSNEDYMKMWRVVIKIMMVLGKGFVFYAEDQKGSSGCREEMKIVTMNGGKSIIIR